MARKQQSLPDMEAFGNRADEIISEIETFADALNGNMMKAVDAGAPRHLLGTLMRLSQVALDAASKVNAIEKMAADGEELKRRLQTELKAS